MYAFLTHVSGNKERKAWGEGGGSYSATGKANTVSKLLQSNTAYLLDLPH